MKSEESNGFEPYFLIISIVWTCGWEDMADWAKTHIRKTLTKLGKTEEEMLVDAKAEEKAWVASIQSVKIIDDKLKEGKK